LIDRDFELKKHKYSANSYIEVLDTKIGLYYPGTRYIFMQDNTSIHIVKKIKDWFKIRKLRHLISPFICQI
jgi:hypothetical protein